MVGWTSLNVPRSFRAGGLEAENCGACHAVVAAQERGINDGGEGRRWGISWASLAMTIIEVVSILLAMF